MGNPAYKQINVDEETHRILQELAASEGRTLMGQVTHLAHEVVALRKEVAELRDRSSMGLLRLRQEEQCREGWRARALKAEAR